MAHLTLKKVNREIAKRGGKEILVNGGGYFYFAEGEADFWFADSIYTMYLNDYSLEEWIQEWQDRRDEYAAKQKEDTRSAP
jgi:hypothetical protein